MENDFSANPEQSSNEDEFSAARRSEDPAAAEAAEPGDSEEHLPQTEAVPAVSETAVSATERDEENEAADADEEDAAMDTDEGAEPEEEVQPDNKHWYVVKVQSGREESIKEAIERRVKIEGLEDYFDQVLIPTEKETIVNKKTNKRITREKKKFPGYIMARVEYNDQILYLFRETSGVGDFVGGGPSHPPLPMTEQEVARMIGSKVPGKEGEKSALAPEESPFSIGDHVQVKNGVFSGMEGEVKEVLPNKGQVRVELFVLGRPVNVELEYWEVEQS